MCRFNKSVPALRRISSFFKSRITAGSNAFSARLIESMREFNTAAKRALYKYTPIVETTAVTNKRNARIPKRLRRALVLLLSCGFTPLKFFFGINVVLNSLSIISFIIVLFNEK